MSGVSNSTHNAYSIHHTQYACLFFSLLFSLLNSPKDEGDQIFAAYRLLPHERVDAVLNLAHDAAPAADLEGYLCSDEHTAVHGVACEFKE